MICQKLRKLNIFVYYITYMKYYLVIILNISFTIIELNVQFTVLSSKNSVLLLQIFFNSLFFLSKIQKCFYFYFQVSHICSIVLQIMQHDMVIMCVFKLASCYARDLPDCRCSTVYTSYDILIDTNKSSYDTQLELFGCTSSCNR